MSQLFENYPINGPKIGANNKIKILPREPEFYDTIWPGADCTHSFRINRARNDIRSFAIYYKQGTETIIMKTIDDAQITEKTFRDHTYCIVSYLIHDYESAKFNFYNTNCSVQMKTYLTSGEIEYSPIFKIKIEKNLFSTYEIKEYKEDEESNNTSDTDEGGNN